MFAAVCRLFSGTQYFGPADICFGDVFEARCSRGLVGIACTYGIYMSYNIYKCRYINIHISNLTPSVTSGENRLQQHRAESWEGQIWGYNSPFNMIQFCGNFPNAWQHSEPKNMVVRWTTCQDRQLFLQLLALRGLRLLMPGLKQLLKAPCCKWSKWVAPHAKRECLSVQT